MKKLAWLVALLALAGVAYAEDDKPKDKGGERPRGMFVSPEEMDANKDGKVTLEEFQAAQTKMTEARFARMDKNSDGVIGKDEIPTPPAGAGGEGGRPRFMPDFTKMDKDGNGSITKEEFAESSKAMGAERFAKIDANSDGAVTKEEFEAARPQRGGPGGPGSHRGPPEGGDKK